MSFSLLVKRSKGNAILMSLWLIQQVAKFSNLDRGAQSFFVGLLKDKRIFDREYYLASCPEIKGTGISPLRHYIMLGDKENLLPNAVFEPSYYRSQIKGSFKNVNSLIHYIYLGRYLDVNTCQWFDRNYYLNSNPDVRSSGLDPLLHYIEHGGVEGRLPSKDFDGGHYLLNNPDVSELNVNPLIHYLKYGQFEGRRINCISDDRNERVASSEMFFPDISSFNWNVLTPRIKGDISVDVIVPVYKGMNETLSCLYSVLSASSDIIFRLIVINDASPDEELSAFLRVLADKELFLLEENESNQGFVKTANIGMRFCSINDVILLNSDTEVYDFWIDRILAAAEINVLSATITPLSNNATICSYPRFQEDNVVPLELSYAELDDLVADVNKGKSIVAPTGIGFCFYIRRSCLNQIGFFDESAFGRGYGEENDFCQRAIKAGWVNLIAADVFVRHWGGTSFGSEKGILAVEALKVLDQRYPSYQSDVHAFVNKDPLADVREKLDWARLKRQVKNKNVLVVCHNRGGGTERYVQENANSLRKSGYGIFFLRPHPRISTHAYLTHYSIQQLPNLPLLALKDIQGLVSLWERLRITELHVHSLVDFHPEFPVHLMSVVSEYKSKGYSLIWKANQHDYEAICPRITLTNKTGDYCGEPDEPACNKCLITLGSSFNVIDIKKWRLTHESCLMLADEVVVPSGDMEERLEKYFPALNYVIDPHEKLNIPLGQDFAPVLEEERKINIVIIGAISYLKGFKVVLDFAKYVAINEMPFSVVIMGYTADDATMRSANIEVTGAYHDTDAPFILESLEADLVWLPSICPETYSYTLSLALQSGVPIMAFDIGAIAYRLRSLEKDNLILPLCWKNDSAKIAKNLLSFIKY